MQKENDSWNSYKNSALLDGDKFPEEFLDLANRSSTRYEVVDRLVDLEKTENGYSVRLQWEGLPEERDITDMPLEKMFENIPEMVSAFLSQCRKHETCSRCRQTIQHIAMSNPMQRCS